MKENRLHQLWRSKNLPLNNLQLTDGRKLEIIHFGYYNHSAPGPDFALGIIEIDGETFSGSIEMHLKSSDWYSHDHQCDDAYNSVVLHVVLDYDREVYINQEILPTLELKSIIHPFYLLENQLSRSVINPFPCSGRKVKIKYFDEMKEWAIQKRLKELRINSEDSSFDDWTYLLARAFSRSNLTPEFLREFLPSRSEFYGRNRRSFKSESVREAQFNTLRNLDPQNLSALSHNQLNRSLNNVECPSIGSDFWRSIRINALFPFLYHQGHLSIDEVFHGLRATAAETNYVTRQWQEAGFKIQNSFDSQGLTFLNRYKCELKKCLTCAVGKEILRNDSKNCVLL